MKLVVHPSAELFRFARLAPTPVVDLEHRAAARGLPADAAKRRTWARSHLSGGRVARTLEALEFPYAEHLKRTGDIEKQLPSRADLRDADAFAKLNVASDERYREDLARVSDTLLALAFDKGARATGEQDRVARLAQFVEAFPHLVSSARPASYAPILTKRVARVAKARTKDKANERMVATVKRGEQLTKLASAVRTLWRARNEHLEKLNRAHTMARRERTVVPELPKPAGSAARKKLTRAQLRSAANATARARDAAARKVADARKNYDDARANSSLGSLIAGNAKIGKDRERSAEIREATATIKNMGNLFNIPTESYCHAFAAAATQMDEAGIQPAPSGAADMVTETFDSPSVSFVDAVRVLGKAELVRVDEEFVRYMPGEISYIQTVLAGEKRKREVRSENTSESTTEQLRDEITERAQETSATTKAELKSEVEMELRTRLDSSVNASGNASGGGTIGVVDVSGAASVAASVGVGVDTGTRSKNESQFSTEVVQKGLERTSRRTMERRMTRNVQTYAALDSHEIDNTGGEMMNGTYVFLNKRVAIKETVYGARAFLEAKLIAPGRALVAARMNRVRAAEDAMGARPLFTISPADIHPGNYMRLAGEFRAQNVEPPPPPISNLTRVYKTDTSTAATETEQFNGKKIADVLVPFFGQYKRFLITDNVDIPEGYEVADVVAAVSHGANGMSIPAHLPFTLPTTVVYAGASFTPFVAGILGLAFLPAWVWSVAYMGSPLLHYNADSSNVTVTIGTEGKDSPYFFFEPDELLNVITGLLQSLSAASPDFLNEVRGLATTAIGEMAEKVAEVPPEIAGRVTTALTNSIGAVREVLDSLAHGRFKQAKARFENMADVSPVDLNELTKLPAVFTPLTTFVNGLAGLVTRNISDAIAQTFGMLLTSLDNTQEIPFFRAEGTRGRLPVTINALALKPGITVTVSACLRRTNEALARWQLRTFDAFYQAHLQLVAVYENRLYQRNAAAEGRNPISLRREEHAAVKERVLNAINGRRDASPLGYDIERLALFEHALDWENMTWRLFNYGPSADELRFERQGVLLGADDRRRQFLTASWAEAMIPLQAHPGLEAQMLSYFDSGGGSVDAAVPEGENRMNELAALYRDLVRSRDFDQPVSETTTFATVPTELVALYRPTLVAELPRNEAYDGLDT